MKTKLFTAVLATALFAACQSPTPVAPPAIGPLPPRVNDRVAANYCSTCPDRVGRVYITTLTKVSVRNGKWIVHAREFPNGLPVGLVAEWERTTTPTLTITP